MSPIYNTPVSPIHSLSHIRANDVVELWCCGANVPGAWLESRVKRVRNGRYCVGKVPPALVVALSHAAVSACRGPMSCVTHHHSDPQHVTLLT